MHRLMLLADRLRITWIFLKKAKKNGNESTCCKNDK